jgi:uncharacterized protein
MNRVQSTFVKCLLAILCAAAGAAQDTSDIPKTFAPPTEPLDYVKRDIMIPMRDGVKLYTVIVVPKGAKNAPILLTRTPYNAASRAARNNSAHMLALLPQGDEVFVQAGYIRVFQDVRGKYKSEGAYLMTRRPEARSIQPQPTRQPTHTTPSTGW